GCGGSAVLTDVVPSKSLIATAEMMANVADSTELGLRFSGGADDAPHDTTSVSVDLAAVNRRVLSLAQAQSDDIRDGLKKAGVELVTGTGRVLGPGLVEADCEGNVVRLEADVVLLSVGTHPRE